MREGLIADPFQRMFETSARWVDERDWVYRCEFEWQPKPGAPRRVLRFDCLDTIATITLNGEPLGQAQNMHTPVEFDVTDRLVAGVNELQVLFESPVRVGIDRRRDYFERQGIDWNTNWFDERAFIRKPGYMSGWDWGPRLVSCGIAGPVSLLEFESRIVRASFLQQPLESGAFKIRVELEIEGESGATVRVGDHVRKPGESLEFELNGPRWWPATEGEPALIPVSVELASGHRIDKKIGLRTIRLLRESDESGRSFEFEVNGRRIYARGANWIPDDSFIARADAESIRKRIQGYTRLGFNMLRVWGGGFYESEAFYDACDEAGILVWQDFSYACSYYPDTDEYAEEGRREAEVQVLRLRDRASLALWCGNNENETMWLGKWGGPGEAPPRFYGEKLYKEVLPEVVSRLDPLTPYIETSPTAIPGPGIPEGANVDQYGDSHYWDVWHGRGDWLHYRDSRTRFSSEYGFASSCSLSVWANTLDDADRGVKSPQVVWHDKTGKGTETFHGYVELHYTASASLEDWVYYSQLNQRDAMRFGVEYFRRSPLCRGSLIWQINDCWPVQSWALEDYHRLLKPAGQELARLYAPTLISIVSDESAREIWAISDAAEVRQAAVRWEIVDTVSGDVLDSGSEPCELQPYERKLVARIDLSPQVPTRTALSAWFDGDATSQTWSWSCEPKDLQTTPIPLHVRREENELVVQLDGFVADLVIVDLEQGGSVLAPQTGLPGAAAVSARGGTLRYGLAGPIGHLLCRSLAGVHEVNLRVSDK